MADTLGRRLSLLLPGGGASRLRLAPRVPPVVSELRALPRIFGDLRVRPKFMVLHNVFFLILTLSIYFSLVPLVQERVTAAKNREFAIASKALEENRLGPNMGYPYAEGDARTLELPSEALAFLGDNPGRIYRHRTEHSEILYALGPAGFRRADIPTDFYDVILSRLRWTLAAILAAVYILSVLMLEFLIMPRYVYSRINLMLSADRAVRDGDRRHEMIDPDKILDDEIGEIMRSRNLTVAALREHEEELNAALATLEAQDRLASLGLLSASVAHELNTPLAVLQGSLEKLAEQPADLATRQRLDRMLRVTSRIRKIAESLIDFARVRRDVMEPIRLKPLVEEAWELVGIDERAALVRFDNQAGLVDSALGNGDRLIQVFVNLLRNSINAIQPPGEIRVSSKILTEGGKRWAVLYFDDSGPGIPPEVLPAIFDAFVSTRLDSRGTGLGLTIAEGIVHQHGGTISASNRPEGGARIEVKLPAA